MTVSNIGDIICFDSLMPYKVVGLFEGGFGQVFHLQSESESEDPLFSSSQILTNHYNYIWRYEIAAKRINSKDHQEAFFRECTFMLRLKHPSIISLLGVKRVGSDFYALMPLCSGNLRDVIDQRRIPQIAMFRSLLSVIDALDYANRNHEINHLDIKPENILYEYRGGEFRFFVSDWGLAQAFADAPTLPAGTIPYMAPERFHGVVKAVSADMFSLGIILYEMAVGSRPFHGKPYAEIVAGDYFGTASDRLSNYPSKIRELILKMIDPEVHRRFDSYAALKKSMSKAF